MACLLFCRPLSKASMDARVYFPVPDTLPSVSYLFGNSPISKKRKGSPHCQLEINTRASILVGQEVHGDAILAAVGSLWKSLGTMSCDNISLSSYHRSSVSFSCPFQTMFCFCSCFITPRVVRCIYSPVWIRCVT
jgi:hypothetical protein